MYEAKLVSCRNVVLTYDLWWNSIWSMKKSHQKWSSTPNITLSSIQHWHLFNPFFALDIFICSFHKCIQYTTRGQSNFPLSKLCCFYIFIVLKYQGLVMWWVKKVQKEGKRSSERFRGIIFLLYWPEHGCSSLTESSHALISPRCGDSSPHLPLYPPPPSMIPEEEERVSSPVNDWEGNSHPKFDCDTKVSEHSDSYKRPHRGAWDIFWLEILQKTVSP